MSDKWKETMGKFVLWLRNLWYWLYPFQIFEVEPMEFHFARFKGKEKVRYDIRKHFLSFSIKTKDDGFKYAFFILLISLVFMMMYICRDVGVSPREWQQNEYSEALYRHYRTADETYKEMPQFATRGQAADMLLVVMLKTLHIDDVYAVKHTISAILGWLILVTLGFFVAKIISWRCAFFFTLFLFCTPRFSGYVIGNFNDTLFALAFYFTLTQIWMLCYDFPLIRWSRLLCILLGMIIATTTSLSGFSLVYFFFFYTLVYFFVKNPLKKFFTRRYVASLITLIMILTGTTLVVIACNMLFSPGFHFADLRRTDNFMQLFVATSDQAPQFFGGKIISTAEIPANYVLKIIFITIPFMVFVGLVFALVYLRTFLKEFSLFTIFILFYTLVYLLLSFSTRYVGQDLMCTILFMLLPLVVMWSAMGYEAILRHIDDRYANGVIIALALFLTCLPLRHILFNRPMTLCYFNEISGGIHNAAERYALDVNQQSSKVADKWFRKYYTAQQDSVINVGKQQLDSLLMQMDTTEIAELDSSFYDIKLDTIDVYTNGGPYFCQILAKDNPYLRVHCESIHSLAELRGDYYILFGNTTNLFNQTEQAIHTIDLERIPVVSFFKKDKKLKKIPERATN